MIDIFEFLKKCNFSRDAVVLEIGAHMGFDTEKLRSVTKANIFSFEPDPRNIKIMKDRGIDNQVSLIEKAVGNSNESQVFYLSTGDVPESTGNDYYDMNEWTASSSLRPFKNHTSMFPWCTTKQEILVDTITLDTFTKENSIKEINFIWMDVQGAEDLIFIGGQDILKHTDFIFTEYSNMELYDGQKTLDELIELLPGNWIIKGYDSSGLNVLLENEEHRRRLISPTGAWDTKETNEHIFDKGLANGIKKYLLDSNCHTAYDFGCGDGKYVKFLHNTGIEIKGFDGNPYTTEISNERCSIHDLTQLMQLEPVEWIISLEVGEHIPKYLQDIFIKNIIDHASVGVIISWGIPDQGGFGHVNCATNEYIIEQFTVHNFINIAETQNLLRWMSSNSWFKDTVMVFKKQEII